MLAKLAIYALFAGLAKLQQHSLQLRFLTNWLTFHAIEHDSGGDIAERNH
jgi:hypothetical protein